MDYEHSADNVTAATRLVCEALRPDWALNMKDGLGAEWLVQMNGGVVRVELFASRPQNRDRTDDLPDCTLRVQRFAPSRVWDVNMSNPSAYMIASALVAMVDDAKNRWELWRPVTPV